MKNKIILELDKSVTRLAGYHLGKDVYEKQVKGKVDLTQPIILVFPDNIVRLASSFVQGFFGEWTELIGISGIENQIEIDSVNPQIKRDILDNLM